MDTIEFPKIFPIPDINEPTDHWINSFDNHQILQAISRISMYTTGGAESALSVASSSKFGIVLRNCCFWPPLRISNKLIEEANAGPRGKCPSGPVYNPIKANGIWYFYWYGGYWQQNVLPNY